MILLVVEENITMFSNTLSERYARYFIYLVYPVVGGLVFAMLISSLFFYLNYKPVIKRPSFKSYKRASKMINIDRAVTTILNKNILDLKIADKVKGSGKTTVVSIDNIKLLGVFIGEDRMAIVKSGDEMIYLKPGDVVSGYKVKRIDFDQVKLIKGDREYILSFPEKEEKVALNRAVQEKRQYSPSSDISNDLNNIVVKRSEILEKSKDLNKLLTTVRIIPFYRKNEFIGYRLAMLRRDSFLHKLGLRAGDIIKRVNGEDVSSPERLIEMLSKLESITAVNIDLIRRGQRKTLFIEIED